MGYCNVMMSKLDHAQLGKTTLFTIWTRLSLVEAVRATEYSGGRSSRMQPNLVPPRRVKEQNTN